MRNGLYIYGVIASDRAQAFGRIGIGIEPTQVETLGYKSLAAVVSRSPLASYDTLAKDRVVKDLVTHQFVIEQVMKHSTIIPVKFGTMIESEEDVSTFLKQGYGLLSEELRKMQDKIELDVVATWEMPKVLAKIRRQNAQIQEMQKEIVRQGANASLEEKITLGQLIEQALQVERDTYYQTILQNLQQVVINICLHERANEEMIFNAAFLLEKKQEVAFTESIESLDRQLENTVNFRLVGPLPLYSFSTILLEKLDPRKVEEAKHTFGLQTEITDKSVRETYHQLAQKYHPDTNGGEVSNEFHLIHAAYKTLKEFTENGLMHVEVYRWEKDLQV